MEKNCTVQVTHWVVYDKFRHIIHSAPTEELATKWWLSPACKDYDVEIIEEPITTPLKDIVPLFVVLYNKKCIGFFFEPDRAKECADGTPGSIISETDYQTFLKYNVEL